MFREVAFMVLGCVAVFFSIGLVYLSRLVQLPRATGRLTSPWADFVARTLATRPGSRSL